MSFRWVLLGEHTGTTSFFDTSAGNKVMKCAAQQMKEAHCTTPVIILQAQIRQHPNKNGIQTGTSSLTDVPGKAKVMKLVVYIKL